MNSDLVPCQLCSELKQAIVNAEMPSAPELAVGLTEAGKRNRMQQREEKLAGAVLTLERHQQRIHHQGPIVKLSTKGPQTR